MARSFLKTATVFALLLVMVLSCSSAKQLAAPDNVKEMQSGLLEGFLQFSEIPNSLLLIPAPPFEGSTAFEVDREANQKALEMRDSDRWIHASGDAVLYFPEATEAFKDAIDFQISIEETPHLYTLLRRSLTDAVLSTYRAKKHYNRPRPFMINGKPTCTPEEEEYLRDGSYPSGHAAVGWAWALILSEIFPDKCNRILARGREFGDSRVICNVHWQSDVDEGRTMGTATVAVLQSNPVFRANMKAAKREVSSTKR